MNLLTENPILSLFFVVSLVYSSVFTGKPTVNPDAQIIIRNLESWNSLPDYLKALVSFKSFDFQTLRDLTFITDMFCFHT